MSVNTDAVTSATATPRELDGIATKTRRARSQSIHFEIAQEGIAGGRTTFNDLRVFVPSWLSFFQEQAREWGDHQINRVFEPVSGNRFTGHAAAVAQIAATIRRSVAVQQFRVIASGGYANPIPGPRDRREVDDDDHEIPGGTRHPYEGDDAGVAVVAIDPPEPRRLEIDLVERRLVSQVPVESLHVAANPDVRGIVEQVPVEALFVVPLAPLAEFAAHEEQLLARMSVHQSVQRAKRRVLLPHVAGHFVEHRTFAMNDFVVRERQDEVLREGIEHGERQEIMVPASMDRLLLRVLEDVVHPSHIPFVGEPEAAEMHRTADSWKGGRLLGGGDRPRVGAMRQRVQPLEKIDGFEVLPPAKPVRQPLTLGPRIIEIQHRRDRVDA